MSDDRGSGTGKVLAAFAIGAAVGAVVALLVAPRSGEETRGRLRTLARDAEEKLKSRLRVAEEPRET